MYDCIDHEARAMAREAQQIQSGHERLCAERWEMARQASQKTHEAITSIYARSWWVVGGVMTLLLTIIGMLLHQDLSP